MYLISVPVGSVASMWNTAVSAERFCTRKRTRLATIPSGSFMNGAPLFGRTISASIGSRPAISHVNTEIPATSSSAVRYVNVAKAASKRNTAAQWVIHSQPAQGSCGTIAPISARPCAQTANATVAQNTAATSGGQNTCQRMSPRIRSRAALLKAAKSSSISSCSPTFSASV